MILGVGNNNLRLYQIMGNNSRGSPIWQGDSTGDDIWQYGQVSVTGITEHQMRYFLNVIKITREQLVVTTNWE